MLKSQTIFVSILLIFSLFFIGCYELEEKSAKTSKILLKGKPSEAHYDSAQEYFSKGKYEEALAAHFKKLEEDLKYYEDDSLEIALDYNNIGLVYDELKNYKKALEYYSKTMKVDELRLEANSTERSTIYFNVASVYDALKSYDEAIHYYEKALKIDEEILEDYDDDILSHYGALAEAYENASKASLSLLYLKKALDFKENQYGRDDARTKEARVEVKEKEEKIK